MKGDPGSFNVRSLLHRQKAPMFHFSLVRVFSSYRLTAVRIELEMLLFLVFVEE